MHGLLADTAAGFRPATVPHNTACVPPRATRTILLELSISIIQSSCRDWFLLPHWRGHRRCVRHVGWGELACKRYNGTSCIAHRLAKATDPTSLAYLLKPVLVLSAPAHACGEGIPIIIAPLCFDFSRISDTLSVSSVSSPHFASHPCLHSTLPRLSRGGVIWGQRVAAGNVLQRRCE